MGFTALKMSSRITMSDLEAQRRAYDNWAPKDLVRRGHGAPYVQVPGCYPGVVLNPEQRRVAELRCGEADELLVALDKGERFFTAFRLKSFPHSLDKLVDVGVLTKHKSEKHDGHYYKATNVTRSWVLTAIALREERCRILKARAELGEGS